MEIKQFLILLLEELSNLNFVEKVDVQTEVFIVKGRINLKGSRFLQFYYNEQTGTTAFALVENGRRIWGIDFDNIRGWHLHPLENPESHYCIEAKTIKEVVRTLSEVWQFIENNDKNL